MAERAPEPALSAFVAAQSRLLRVESDDPRSLSLLFDRGVLRVDVIDGALELALSAAGDGLGAGSARLDEDDPWWTVIGHPLCGAWSLLDGEGRRTALELQLRPDGENPKIIALEGHGLVLRAIGLPKSQWVGAQ